MGGPFGKQEITVVQGLLAGWLLTECHGLGFAPVPSTFHSYGKHARKVISKQLFGTLVAAECSWFSGISSRRDYLIEYLELIAVLQLIGLSVTDSTLTFSQFRGHLSDPARLLPSRAYLVCKSLYQLIEELQVSTPKFLPHYC
jgi:hypothetical protein